MECILVKYRHCICLIPIASFFQKTKRCICATELYDILNADKFTVLAVRLYLDVQKRRIEGLPGRELQASAKRIPSFDYYHSFDFFNIETLVTNGHRRGTKDLLERTVKGYV